MRSSLPWASIVFLPASAILLAACFAAPAGAAAPGDCGAIGDLRLPDGAPPSRGPSIDEGDGGRAFHVSRGDVLVVRLRESGPYRRWHFSGGDSFRVVRDAAPGSYPAIRAYHVKVRGPGELSFTQIDSRDLFVLKKFTVRIVVDEGEPANDPSTAYPLASSRSAVS